MALDTSCCYVVCRHNGKNKAALVLANVCGRPIKTFLWSVANAGYEYCVLG